MAATPEAPNLYGLFSLHIQQPALVTTVGATPTLFADVSNSNAPSLKMPDGSIQQIGVSRMQPGTVNAPASTTMLSFQPADTNYPPVCAFMLAQTFQTTQDNVFFFGVNANKSYANKPYTLIGFEQDYENSPGIRQLEWYLESALQPGDAASFVRPFAFIHWITGPNAGKVTPSVQYTASFTIIGGTSQASVEQVRFTDTTMLLLPTSYLITAQNALEVNAQAGQLTIEATAGSLFLHASAQSFTYCDLWWFGPSNEGSNLAFIQTAGSVFNFCPGTDNTGNIGTGANRWATLKTAKFESNATGVGFNGAAPVAQPTRGGQLTDSTTGSAGSVLADVGGAFNQATLNNNFKRLLDRVNALELLCHNNGLST